MHPFLGLQVENMLTVFFGQACKAEAIDTFGLTPAQGTFEGEQENVQRVILFFLPQIVF